MTEELTLKGNSERYSQERRNTMRTAFLTAFPKMFTDISYVHEIFAASLECAHEWGFTFTPEQFVANLAVELEARHKALSAAVAAATDEFRDPPVIVELGAGLSPRRLEFKSHSYVEIDLPPVIAIKQAVYTSIGHKFDARELVEADFADADGLESALQIVRDLQGDRQIVVVSEGLFWYLSRADVDQLVRAMGRLLSNGGIWVTADCPPVGPPPVPTGYKSVIAKSSNKKMDQPFSDLHDFATFFEEHGFGLKTTRLEDWVSPHTLLSASLFSPRVDETLERMRSYTDVASISST